MVDEQWKMEITHQGDNQQTGKGDYPTASDIPANDVEVIRRTGECGRNSDEEDGDALEKYDNSQTRDREKAQEDPRRSPNRSKKMKQEKQSVVQHERSRSVNRRATGKGPKK
jgi:hypothetical protein